MQDRPAGRPMAGKKIRRVNRCDMHQPSRPVDFQPRREQGEGLGRRVDALGHHDNDKAGSVHEELTRGLATASPACFF